VIELGRAFNLKIALAIGASVGIVQLLSAVLFAWKGSDGLLLATTISGFETLMRPQRPLPTWHTPTKSQ